MKKGAWLNTENLGSNHTTLISSNRKGIQTGTKI